MNIDTLPKEAMQDVGTVGLPIERYNDLLEAERKLRALESTGVDNWQFYDDAMNILNDEGV